MALGFFNRSLRSPWPSFRRKPESRCFNSFCTFVCAGLACSLALLSCSLPRPNPLLEGPKLKGFEQVSPLTVYNRINLFDYMNGEAEAYLPFGFHLLYVSLYGSEKTDSKMVLEIYDMSTLEGAAAILKKYSGETSPAGAHGTNDTAEPAEAPVLLRQGFGGHPPSSSVGRSGPTAKAGEGGSRLPGIGDAAWADKGIILFTQANYFVRIFPDPSPENQVRPTMQEMLDLARELAPLF